MAYLLSVDWETYLRALREPGRSVEFAFESGGSATLEMVDAGSLHLSSGRVMIAEPMPYPPDFQADMIFASVPPGTYPVQIVTACSERGGRKISSGAAVRLLIGTNDVASWSPAVGESLDEAMAFGVDGGMAIIMDADEFPRLNHDEFESLLDEETWAGQVRVGFPATGDHYAIAFECGMGDGAYRVFLGRDSDGRVTELLADLELCAWCREWAVIADELPS